MEFSNYTDYTGMFTGNMEFSNYTDYTGLFTGNMEISNFILTIQVCLPVVWSFQTLN